MKRSIVFQLKLMKIAQHLGLSLWNFLNYKDKGKKYPTYSSTEKPGNLQRNKNPVWSQISALQSWALEESEAMSTEFWGKKRLWPKLSFTKSRYCSWIKVIFHHEEVTAMNFYALNNGTGQMLKIQDDLIVYLKHMPETIEG